MRNGARPQQHLELDEDLDEALAANASGRVRVTRRRDGRQLPAHALVLSESPEDVFGEREGRVAVHASGGESGALRVAVADRRRGVRERLELPSLVPSAAWSGGQRGVVSVAETLSAWKRRAFSTAR